MRVLVVGSGGREHALCWAIAQSPRLTKLYCAPGNPGIAQIAECVIIGAMEIQTLTAFAQRAAIDLVIIGPEGPLVRGITDSMLSVGVSCCGPTQAAAILESSKSFAKEVCRAAGIPTADGQRFEDANAARVYVREHGAPLVVKADGLAAGKGVVVAHDEATALDAIDLMMKQRVFGNSGASVVIEEYLEGPEISFFALCDGTTAIPLGVAQDHKRLGTHDTGPNTGGMGAYSPPPMFTDQHRDQVMATIVQPALIEMERRGRPYRGVLFAGLMMCSDGIKLIEFNVRFGDPECQALVMRLGSDLLQALNATCCGHLESFTPRWAPITSVAVVMAAPGYPDAPNYGGIIRLGPVRPHVEVFHAGTELFRRQLRVAGGRVLTVCATGADVAEAQARAYAAIDAIDWPEAQYRRDIGWQALSQ